jgi:hypothetical protein
MHSLLKTLVSSKPSVLVYHSPTDKNPADCYCAPSPICEHFSSLKNISLPHSLHILLFVLRIATPFLSTYASYVSQILLPLESTY